MARIPQQSARSAHEALVQPPRQAHVESAPTDLPIVWTALYSLIAIAGWRTWMQEDSPERSRALRLWATQLATNAEWTHLFFGRHNPKQSLFDVVALEAQIVSYIRTVKDVDPAAAACFLPYAAWVAFATLLNAEIVRRNPHAETMLPRAA